MIDDTYKLSRIYAKGWALARAMPSNDNNTADLDALAELHNPYTKEEEHSRWNAGFLAALTGKRGNAAISKKPPETLHS